MDEEQASKLDGVIMNYLVNELGMSVQSVRLKFEPKRLAVYILFNDKPVKDEDRKLVD